MSSVRAPQPNISVEDYLAGEQHAEVRHEYIHGQVYAMTGASDRHGLIVNAMAFALTAAALGITFRALRYKLKKLGID